MTHRLAIATASLAAAGTLAVAVVATGFAPLHAAGDPPSTGVETTVAGGGAPTIQVDTIYLAPPPPQQTIVVNRSAGEHEVGEADEHGADDD